MTTYSVTSLKIRACLRKKSAVIGPAVIFQATMNGVSMKWWISIFIFNAFVIFASF